MFYRDIAGLISLPPLGMASRAFSARLTMALLDLARVALRWPEVGFENRR